MKTRILLAMALIACMMLADMPETAETDESGQSAGEAAGTVAEDATKAPTVLTLAERRRGRCFS